MEIIIQLNGNHISYNPPNNYTMMSLRPSKLRRLNCLAQVNIAIANHVITQIQSEYADKKDGQSMTYLLNNTINNSKELGLLFEEVLAEGSYSNSDALKALCQNNVVGCISNSKH